MCVSCLAGLAEMRCPSGTLSARCVGSCPAGTMAQPNSGPAAILSYHPFLSNHGQLPCHHHIRPYLRSQPVSHGEGQYYLISPSMDCHLQIPLDPIS